MTERFGMPDHSPQHAPDHAPQSTTPQGGWGTGPGWGDDAPPSAPSYTGSGGVGGGAGVSFGGPAAPSKRSVLWTAGFALVFGPLGLFYVGFLHGVAALIVTWTVLRSAALLVGALTRGGIEPFPALIAMIWCTMIPWAVVGATLRNRKLDRRARLT